MGSDTLLVNQCIIVCDLSNFRANIRNILTPNERKNHSTPETRKPLKI